jgi:hypothetical protein
MRGHRPARAPARPAIATAGVIAAAAGMLLASAAIGACGRKAPPRPPQFVIPESPAPVVVTAVSEGLKVSWRRPREYADGTRIDDLGGFEVFRDCEGGGFWTPIAELPVSDRERFRKGQTFSYVDPGMAPDAPCRYRVVASTTDGYRSPPAEGAVGEVPATPEPQPTPTPPVLPGAQPGEIAPDEYGERLPAQLLTPTPWPPPPP